MPARAVVSPAPTEEEEEDRRRRRIPSPSPEIEFLDHEHDDASDDLDDTTSIFSRDRSGSPSSRNSPPLEGDEQEFSDNAISLSIKHRSASRDLKEGVPTPPLAMDDEANIEHEHHTTFLAPYNINAPAIPHPSPIVRPISPKAVGDITDRSSVSNHKSLEVITTFKIGEPVVKPYTYESWSDLKSPETVNLQELDLLLGSI